MGKASAPKSPDPVVTANAQTASNRETAQSQAQLNMIDQVGPGGTQKYNQIGTYADGTPKYQQTTTLDPKSEGIYNAGLGTQQNLANVAQEQSGKLGALLNQPFSLDNEATEARLMELGSKRLDPALARNREAEITRLSNQGVKIGSTAYDRALEGVNQSENDARNQLLLNGRQQSVNEALTQRNQPLNELLALSGQGQIQMPSFGATPQTGVAGTDVAGITNQAYQNQVAAVNAQNAGTGQMLGGLFGAGASLLAAPATSVFGKMFSDERLKTNIEKTGDKIAGVPVVEWDWKDGSGHDRGVLAQALERKHPSLVDRDHPSGFRRVDYGRLMQLGAKGAR